MRSKRKSLTCKYTMAATIVIDEAVCNMQPPSSLIGTVKYASGGRIIKHVCIKTCIVYLILLNTLFKFLSVQSRHHCLILVQVCVGLLTPLVLVYWRLCVLL